MGWLQAGVACVALLVIGVATCGKNTVPVRSGHDDAGKAEDAACEAQRNHLVVLYSAAADSESVSENLRVEFVESLVHMVMKDCQHSPRQVASCLGQAQSAKDLESLCLLPIDDEGQAEGRQFSGG